MEYGLLFLDKQAFNCPFCGTFSRHDWFAAYGSEIFEVLYSVDISGLITDESDPLVSPSKKRRSYKPIQAYLFACCNHCNNYSVWDAVKEVMIYPISGTVPPPNEDMPKDVKADYNEARLIVGISPRGASALLRLAVQKLCKQLGEKGENINDDIASLVKKGLPEKIQKALDSIRVIGNNAVHPGQIDLKDDTETAYKLFGFINIIVEVMISQPNAIDEIYTLKVPDKQKDAIKKRDGKK